MEDAHELQRSEGREWSLPHHAGLERQRAGVAGRIAEVVQLRHQHIGDVREVVRRDQPLREQQDREQRERGRPAHEALPGGQAGGNVGRTEQRGCDE